MHSDIDSLPKFLRTFGPRPAEGWTLDRIDPGNPTYSAENCRWASKQLQSENRGIARYLTDSAGTELPVSEWSRRTGIPRKTILERVRRGWDEHTAVHTPVKRAGQRRSFTLGDLEDFPAPTDSPRKSPVASPASPQIQKLLSIFTTALKDHHEMPFFVAETKHLKMLADIAKLLEAGGLDPEKVLTLAIHNWVGAAGFGQYANDRGSYRPPAVPTIEFCRANVIALGNFSLHKKESAKREAREQREAAKWWREQAGELARLAKGPTKAWDAPDEPPATMAEIDAILAGNK